MAEKQEQVRRFFCFSICALGPHEYLNPVYRSHRVVARPNQSWEDSGVTENITSYCDTVQVWDSETKFAGPTFCRPPTRPSSRRKLVARKHTSLAIQGYRWVRRIFWTTIRRQYQNNIDTITTIIVCVQVYIIRT